MNVEIQYVIIHYSLFTTDVVIWKKDIRQLFVIHDCDCPHTGTAVKGTQVYSSHTAHRAQHTGHSTQGTLAQQRSGVVTSDE